MIVLVNVVVLEDPVVMTVVKRLVYRMLWRMADDPRHVVDIDRWLIYTVVDATVM